MKISDKKYRKLAKKAGFAVWGEESWRPVGVTIDWSSEYSDETIKKFGKLYARWKKRKKRKT